MAAHPCRRQAWLHVAYEEFIKVHTAAQNSIMAEGNNMQPTNTNISLNIVLISLAQGVASNRPSALFGLLSRVKREKSDIAPTPRNRHKERHATPNHFCRGQPGRRVR